VYRTLVFPLLSRLEPERAHHLALRALRDAARVPGGLAVLRALAGPRDPRLRVRAFGLDFPNPLGVAAGLDKNAEAVAGLFSLGFGAVEIGTVTPRPQPGNAQPRVWRLPAEKALLNALGFPSEGAEKVAERIRGKRFPGILGVNLGKNKETAAAKAPDDFAAVMRVLGPHADYAVVNVSSPNTPGLRDLQGRKALGEILAAVREANRTSIPVLVKLSPDMEEAQLADAVGGALEGGARGLVVSNTTLDRSGLREKFPERPGGLSGAPLREKALGVLKKVRALAGPGVPLVGVGGIATAEDALARLAAGASLVQLYTAFVYGGPGLAGRILKGLANGE
jgi:dihydroorotate dehydrogenase